MGEEQMDTMEQIKKLKFFYAINFILNCIPIAYAFSVFRDQRYKLT